MFYKCSSIDSAYTYFDKIKVVCDDWTRKYAITIHGKGGYSVEREK